MIFDIENWLWKYDLGTFWRTKIHRPIFLKIFPLSMLILGQKSCFLGSTILKIPQSNWYCTRTYGNLTKTKNSIQFNAHLAVVMTFYFYLQIMFFLFVAWMAIIIMNLLIGLTISSLEKLNEKAEKMRVKSRLDELRENKHVKKSFVRRREGIIKTLKNNKSPSYKVIYLFISLHILVT